MPGPTYAIKVELAHLIPEGAPITRDSFPYLAHAVETIVAAAHARWTAFASGVPLPDGRVINNRTGEYQRSIQTRMCGDFAGEVFSELPYAAAIEQGSPARDMKSMLNSSLKVRISKDGRRYLIIPFRHDVPGSDSSVSRNTMPVEVHKWFGQEGRTSSAVTGRFLRPSGTGAFDLATKKRIMVPGWRYQWGSRLGKDDLAGMGFGPDDRVAKRLKGMVNFRTPSATGGASNSKYLTFRVMAQGSPGWLVPAREGFYPARTTADEIRSTAEELFRQAAEADIRRLLAE
jgi:hypothetical protein